MRTLLGDGEGVCSGVGEGGTDCSGEIEGEEDSSSVGEGAGADGSCPSAREGKIAITTARIAVVIMSSVIERSLTV